MEKFRVRSGVRRARMPAWTLKCVLVILREPGGQPEVGMLIGTIGSHLSLLPVIRK